MTLDEQDIEALARRVAQLLSSEPQAPVRLLDAAQLARTLGVRRDWVYQHATQLGAIRLGGPGGRLRFDLQRARSLLASPDHPAREDARGRRAARRRRLDGSRRSSYRRCDKKPVGRAALSRPRP